MSEKCSPLRLMFGSVLSDVAITANTDYIGDLSDLHNELRSRFIEFDRDDTVVLEAVLPGTVGVNTFGLGQHNLSRQGIARIELFRDNTLIEDRLYDQNNTLGEASIEDFVEGHIPFCGADMHDWPDPLITFFDEVAYPTRIRITLSDPNNNEGCIKLGLMMAGQYVPLSHGFSYGHHLVMLSAPALKRALSGYFMRTGKRVAGGYWSLSLDDATPEDIKAIHAACSASMDAPILASGFPKGGDVWQDEAYDFIVLLDGDLAATHGRYGGYTAPLKFGEV